MGNKDPENMQRCTKAVSENIDMPEITPPDGGEKVEIEEEAESVPTLCLPEVPESDSEGEEELFLPSVP